MCPYNDFLQSPCLDPSGTTNFGPTRFGFGPFPSLADPPVRIEGEDERGRRVLRKSFTCISSISFQFKDTEMMMANHGSNMCLHV